MSTGDGVMINPLGAPPLAKSRADLEEALAGLQRGEISAEAAVAVMDEYFDAKMSGGGAVFAPAVRSVVARLTESPTNWHQTTVYCLTTRADEDAGLRSRAPGMFAIGVVIVLLQCVAAFAAVAGTIVPACDSKDQCNRGTYCKVHGDESGDGSGAKRCSYCGFSVPLEAECVLDAVPVRSHDLCLHAGVPVLNVHAHELFAGYNMTYLSEVCHRTTPVGKSVRSWAELDLVPWCDACWSTATDTIDHLTPEELMSAHVRSMGLFDWITLFFASVIVALTAVGELKDILMVEMAVTRAVDSEQLTRAWWAALTVMNGARKWCFLPNLIQCVPTLVLFKGGDSVNICLNAIAILFMCEADNIAYASGLGERTRARVEAAGRIELKDRDLVALQRSKVLHVSLIAVYITFEILFVSSGAMWFMITLPLGIMPIWWVAGLVTVCIGGNVGTADVEREGTSSSVPLHLCRVTGACILALLFLLFMFTVSMNVA